MPEYLAQTGYKNPTDPNNGIFQYTKGGFKGGLFEYYDTHQVEGKSFNNVMGGVMANQAGMLDIYPYDVLRDAQSVSSTTPLLVDVGGNVGHDMEKFCQHHPEVASRLVLQDRPDVVSLSKCRKEVMVMAHDFFTPQPVKGALVQFSFPSGMYCRTYQAVTNLLVKELAHTTCMVSFTTGPTSLHDRSCPISVML